MRFALVSAAALAIVHEPHHSVQLQNLKARVLRLTLQPGEATGLHRHDSYYAFVSLKAATLSNEVPGHATKITKLEAAELQTSRGGFELVEWNTTSQPCDVIIVELLNPDPKPFDTPMSAIRYRAALYSDLFETPGMRAYSAVISPGGYIKKREEDFDRLLLALGDITLKNEVTGNPALDLRLKAGESLWIPRTGGFATTNTGDASANLITFEFN